ncbi:MAG: ABC transporter permease [Candidatus Omnitrophota bacterium]
MFKEIIKYRDLLLMLTLRDIRIRYKQAVMGFVWAIFMPIVAVLAGLIVKKAMSVVSGEPMDLKGVVSISIKVLPWTFFINAIKFAVQSLVGNKNLVTKIYFPREVLTLSSILACLFDFAIASITLAIILAVAKIGISVYILWLPVLIIFLVLFTAGLGLLMAAANLFYRDIKYVVEIILMFGIFFTPVFYDASMFGKWAPVLLANPIGSLLEAMNSVIVLHQAPDMFWFTYTGIVSTAIFFIGMSIFHKAEPLFAENI